MALTSRLCFTRLQLKLQTSAALQYKPSSRARPVGLGAIRCLSHYPINDDVFGLTDEQKQLRESVFQFLQRDLAPVADKIDKENTFHGMRDFWRKCAGMGLLGLTAPTQYGGSGASYFDHVIVAEEFSRISAAVCLSYGAHSNLCVNQLCRFGSDEQKSQYLPKLCSGEYIGALAMSEASAGSDVMSMRLRADKDGDHYVLNGTKFWITNGPVADLLIVYAKTNPHTDKPQHGITAFLVEKTMPGFQASPKLDKLGMRGSDTSELVFESCRVPESAVLGPINGGAYVLFSGLDIERLILAAGPVGIMQACCDVAYSYAHQRSQFGELIGRYQMIQSKMADMYVRLNSSRSYLYSITRALDRGQHSPKDCAAVVLYASEAATRSALDAIQILGGNGYINDYPVGRYLRDAKLAEIGGGTSEIRRLVIGRTINSEYRK